MKKRGTVTTEQIQAFFDGKDPMEHIIKFECGYDDSKVSIIYRDENGVKRVKKDSFKPFVWATQRAARELYNGDKQTIKRKLSEYAIECKGLRIHRDDGSVPERMANGYRVLFQARGAMTYTQFMNFFKEGGVPIYPTQRDKNYGRRDYMAVAPVEQYMIQTGKRQFKGYEDYDDLVRMQWDLETEGLDATKDAISQIGIRTNKGFERIISVDGTGSIRLNNEVKALRGFFDTIKEVKPDVVTGHHTENFDWCFNETRISLLTHQTMREFTEKDFKNGVYKKKKQAVLKLGGEMEYYYPTVMWGFQLTDSLFAVRRAQAIDSNIKSANLKYITKYAGLNKPNRVYIPGKMINTVWSDNTESYLFNNENGNWLKYDPNATFTHETGECLRYEKRGDFVWDLKTGEKFEFVTGRYIGERYLMDDLYETDKVELQYNQSNFLVCKMLPVPFEKVCTMGTAAIWKYIMMAWSYENGLAIPEIISKRPFVGGLSRLLKVGFVRRIVKLDYNSLYPSIELTFGIENDVDVMDVLLAMLEYVLSKREHFKELKAIHGDKANELKELLKAVKDASEKTEIASKLANEKKKKNAANTLQLPLKILGNSYFGGSSSGTPFPWTDTNCIGPEQTTCTGRQMLRLMIHHFSNLSTFNGANLSDEYNYIPIVGDTDGFNFQMPWKFRYTDEHPYIGKGLGRNVTKGKAYTGVEADVAEFEDTYLNQAFNGGVLKNGLGVDEYCDACIQFSRKNYADLMPDGSIKLVGNTIKSKKMPKYIEKFLDKGIRLLLNGDGAGFLEAYYDYVEKIYNLQIPLKDIATVGKIKTSIDTYKKSCNTLTAAGNKKARQAWYELAIKHDLNVNMGDSIYYINTGNKKGDSDVQRVTHYYNGETDVTKELLKAYKKYTDGLKEQGRQSEKMTKSEFGQQTYGQSFHEEDEIIFNCVLLHNDIVEDEDDHFCDEDFEYNVAKYIEMFNKRIRPLLVCFSRDIRTVINEKGKEIDNILITNPKDRKSFTEEECKLVAGEPYKKTDQDTYEELMTMEDKEIKFWLLVDKKPPYADEIGMDWESVKADYLKRMEEYEREEIKAEVNAYNAAIAKLSESDVEKMLDEGIVPPSVLAIVDEDANSNNFVSKKYPNVVIGNIFDIIDKNFETDAETDEY